MSSSLKLFNDSIKPKGGDFEEIRSELEFQRPRIERRLWEKLPEADEGILPRECVLFLGRHKTCVRPAAYLNPQKTLYGRDDFKRRFTVYWDLLEQLGWLPEGRVLGGGGIRPGMYLFVMDPRLLPGRRPHQDYR